MVKPVEQFLKWLIAHRTKQHHLGIAQGAEGESEGLFVANPGGSQGVLCLGGSIGRFGLYGSGPNGEHTGTVDPNAIAQPTGTVSALAGQTWFFQSWHRDAVGGSATSNFTNAIGVTFL